jgi:hypothetical protein
MAATIQVSVSDIADTAIVVQSFCKSITVAESVAIANWPTTGFLVKKPLSSSTGIPYNAGSLYSFSNTSGFYYPGQIAGYIRATKVGTSTTFNQDEDQP